MQEILYKNQDLENDPLRGVENELLRITLRLQTWEHRSMVVLLTETRNFMTSVLNMLSLVCLWATQFEMSNNR